jgi:tetratricopeptide (TPR) repeat protein
MEIGDAAGECKLWGNLAKVANHSGLLREAIEYARRALALAGHVEGAGETRMQANQIIGAAYLHLNLFTEGLVAIQNAVREVPKSESALAMLQICRLRCWEANLLIRVGRYEEAAASIGIAADCARKSGNDECIVAVKVVGMVLDAKRDAELAPIALAELKRMLQDPIHRGQRADLIRSLAYLAETYAPEEVTTIRRLVHEYWTRKGIDSVAEQLATLGLASGSAATTANA